MLDHLAAFDSTASALDLKEVYQAVPAPRSGVLSAYRVLAEDEAELKECPLMLDLHPLRGV